MEPGCSDTSLACTPISSVWQLPECLGHQHVFAFLPGISPTVFWPYVYHNILWQEAPQFNSKLCKKSTCSCLFWIFDLVSSNNILLLYLLLGVTVTSHSLFTFSILLMILQSSVRYLFSNFFPRLRNPYLYICSFYGSCLLSPTFLFAAFYIILVLLYTCIEEIGFISFHLKNILVTNNGNVTERKLWQLLLF